MWFTEKPVRFALLLAVLAWGGILFTPFLGEESELTPASDLNVVLFLVDDLGWTDLGCYGSEFYETPHIDQLANEGIRFTQAYSACTVCSPTRAALMTGKSPAQLRLTDWIRGYNPSFTELRAPDWQEYLALEETTLGEVFRQAGYATASIGKWHLGEDSIYYPQYQGFDLNIAGYNKGQPPHYFFPYQRKDGHQLPYLSGGKEGEYLTDRLTSEALQFIDQRGDKPFFLYFPHYGVHTPLQAKDSLIEYYRNKKSPEFQHQNEVYAAMIHSIDESLGRLKSHLEERGELENTLIVFTSDNGGLTRRPWGTITDNSPLRAGKGSPYEGGTRVPFIVRLPDQSQAKTICETPIISMDVFVSLAEYAGLGEQLTKLSDLEGQSLLPLWESPSEPHSMIDRALFWHFPHYHPGGASPYSAIRQGDFKLIEFFEKDRPLELYDLDTDIGETTNLAESEPFLRDSLFNVLQSWRNEVGAQLPLRNHNFDPEKAGEIFMK